MPGSRSSAWSPLGSMSTIGPSPAGRPASPPSRGDRLARARGRRRAGRSAAGSAGRPRRGRTGPAAATRSACGRCRGRSASRRVRSRAAPSPRAGRAAGAPCTRAAGRSSPAGRRGRAGAARLRAGAAAPARSSPAAARPGPPAPPRSRPATARCSAVRSSGGRSPPPRTASSSRAATGRSADSTEGPCSPWDSSRAIWSASIFRLATSLRASRLSTHLNRERSRRPPKPSFQRREHQLGGGTRHDRFLGHRAHDQHGLVGAAALGVDHQRAPVHRHAALVQAQQVVSVGLEALLALGVEEAERLRRKCPVAVGLAESPGVGAADQRRRAAGPRPACIPGSRAPARRPAPLRGASPRPAACRRPRFLEAEPLGDRRPRALCRRRSRPPKARLAAPGTSRTAR